MKNYQPENIIKYCPKCGYKKFIYDQNKSFVCENCNFQMYINSASAVAAIIVNSNNEILLTKRKFNPGKFKLDLPGGFVDPNESAEQALKREIKEELNLSITDSNYLISYPNKYLFSEIIVYTTDLAFVCKSIDLKAIATGGDVMDYMFLSESELNYELVYSDSIKNIIRYYFQTCKFTPKII